MPTVLIVDACKPSLVMSSEVFKDKVSGATILVASTGKQCLEIAATENPDMVVVDFDLPDTDGVTLISAMRKNYRGPILLTAFPDKVVRDAVENDLFVYNDSGAWIPKPVKFDELSEKIDQFLLDKHRLGRRFDVSFDTMVIGKGAGRGKRAPKVSGTIVNLSLGGVCVQMDEPMKMKKADELTVSMTLADPTAGAKSARSQAGRKTTAKAKKVSKKVAKSSASESRIKCKVCWVDRKNHVVGFAFNKLTEVQRKALESMLRHSAD